MAAFLPGFLRNAAVNYVFATRKSEQAAQAFFEKLHREFDLGSNEDLPRRRWEHKKQQEVDFTSHAEKALGEKP